MNLKYLKYKAITGVIILLFIGLAISQVAMSASTTNTNTLIVVLDQPDQAINRALDTLKLELTDPLIIRTSASNYNWITAFQSFNNVVFIGHGSSNGVIIDGKLVTWENYANMANRIKVKHRIYFLNCDSNRIVDYLNTNNKNSITFSNAIDGKGAALIASLGIKYSNNKISEGRKIIDKLMAHIDDLNNKKINIQDFLYFSTSEKQWTFGSGVFLVVGTLAKIWLSEAVFVGFAATLISGLQTLFTVVYSWRNIMENQPKTLKS